MIVWDLQTNTEAREIVTEFLFVNDIFFLSFSSVYLVQQLRATRRLRNLRYSLAFKIFVAVTTHMFGLTLLRGWNMSAYWESRVGHPEIADWLDNTIFPVTGLAITAIGLACMIRVFAPRELGHWGWATALSASLLFVTYMHWDTLVTWYYWLGL